MPRTLRCILHCYRASLWLYPPDLRRAYGRDMAAVYEQFLNAQWTSRGARGVASAVCRAIGELFTIALPRQFASEWMAVAGVTVLINSGFLALLVGVLHVICR